MKRSAPRTRRATALLAAIALMGLVLALSPAAASRSDRKVTARGSVDQLVAVFHNGNYVDNGSGSDAESENVQDDLDAKGYLPKPFTGITSTAISRALAGARFLVIPDLEVDANLGGDLDKDAVRTLKQYVRTGGGLLVFLDDENNAADLLNRLFGYSTVTDGLSPEDSSSMHKPGGTEFDGGPAHLDWNNDTNGFVPASLPPSATSIYKADSSGLRTVVRFKIGEGEVVALGWDWYKGGCCARGIEDGEIDDRWIPVLGRAAKQVTGDGCNVSGTTGADTLEGTTEADQICGRGGADTIEGRGGPDLIYGQKGNDKLFGNTGNDDLFGGAGKDECKQGEGNGSESSC